MSAYKRHLTQEPSRERKDIEKVTEVRAYILSFAELEIVLSALSLYSIAY